MLKWILGKIGIDNTLPEIDGTCPECGDNVIYEYSFIICCNARCNYSRKVGVGESYVKLGDLP